MTMPLADRRAVLAGLAAAFVAPVAFAQDAAFRRFIASLWPDAQALGVSEATFAAATADLEPDAAVIAQSRKQSEFTRPFWDYVEGAVSGARLRAGAPKIAAAARDFAFIEKQLGVDRQVVAGIWGMESNFGAAMGDKDIPRSLASLAFAKYRGDFYRDEFLKALVILEQGHVDRAAMRGSWAGAMGQTQFIPSSFLDYAVDADGDGRKDIWASRRDALASAANHLKRDGWIAGLPWGFEVIVPTGFDFAYGDRMARHAFATFAKLGVTPAAGRWPKGSGGLFLPVGIDGPAFIITDNFEVIRKYNTSDAYAVGVGLLGDRLFGAPALTARWPKDQKQLGAKDLADLQTRLKAMGLPIDKIDGKLGWQTRQGVQAAQKSLGLLPDGHPTPAFLARLRNG
jgi:membrane-bound lytic murein transglycosylase B